MKLLKIQIKHLKIQILNLNKQNKTNKKWVFLKCLVYLIRRSYLGGPLGIVGGYYADAARWITDHLQVLDLKILLILYKK